MPRKDGLWQCIGDTGWTRVHLGGGACGCRHIRGSECRCPVDIEMVVDRDIEGPTCSLGDGGRRENCP